jgi:glycosyltransferase involved in cell wall biosynthesis
VTIALHPTKSEISSLVLVEVGYLGCPVISLRRFAIPHLVDEERTRLLLDDSFQVSTVTSAMCWMLENTDEHRQMRKAAWSKAHGLHSKRNFEERLVACVYEVVSGDRMPAR